MGTNSAGNSSPRVGLPPRSRASKLPITEAVAGGVVDQQFDLVIGRLTMACERVRHLGRHVPGLAPRLAAIKASTLVLLCADIEARLAAACPCMSWNISAAGKHACMQALATRLIQLKGIFPGGDAGRILLQDPASMMTQDARMLEQSAERLRQLLPDVDIDRSFSTIPS